MVQFRRLAHALVAAAFLTGSFVASAAKPCVDCGLKGEGTGKKGVTDLTKFIEGASCSPEETKKQFEQYSARYGVSSKKGDPVIFSVPSYTTTRSQPILVEDEAGKETITGYKAVQEELDYFIQGSKIDRELLDGITEDVNYLLEKNKETMSGRTKALSYDPFVVERISEECGSAFSKEGKTNAECVLGVLYGSTVLEGSRFTIPPDKTIMPGLVRANYVKNGIFLSTVERPKSKDSSLKMHWKPEEARDFLVLGELFEPLRKRSGMSDTQKDLIGLDPIRILASHPSSKRCGRLTLGDTFAKLFGGDTVPYESVVRFKKTGEKGPLVTSFDSNQCAITVREQEPGSRKSLVPELVRSLSKAYELQFSDVLRDNDDSLYQRLRAFTLSNWTPKKPKVDGKPNLNLESRPGEWKPKPGASFLSSRGKENPAKDFAETAAMYISEPEKLRILSPARYAAAKELFAGKEFLGKFPKWGALESAYQEESQDLLKGCKADFEKIRCVQGGVLELKGAGVTSYSCYSKGVSAIDAKLKSAPDYCARSGKATIEEWLQKKLLEEAHSALSEEGRTSCAPVTASAK